MLQQAQKQTTEYLTIYIANLVNKICVIYLNVQTVKVACIVSEHFQFCIISEWR